MTGTLPRYALVFVALALASGGCADLPRRKPSPPAVAPATQPTASLEVAASQIPPMYRRMLAVDLPTVVRVALARNLDIQEAQRRIESSRGQYEANVGMIFPSFSPNITALGLEGAVSTPGGFKVANFSDVFPAVMIQWIINPGEVVYEIIASKRRLEASALQEEAVTQETTRVAAVRYYDLVLAQAQVAVAGQKVKEAQELLRIERLKFGSGNALPADVLRAEAALAATQQDLLTALNGFYNASITLTVTLHLDPTVMLAPKAGTIAQATLVRDDLRIDDLLKTAVRYRPDLEVVRTLLAAAQADKETVAWGGLGPQVQASGWFGPSPPAHSAADTMYREQKYKATAGFDWSAATFGRIKTAVAKVKIAGLDLDRQLDQVRANVVTVHQASLTAAQLIPVASQQVSSAEEALRLTRENLKAGTGLIIDVLQAEAAADRARADYASAIVRYNQSQINLLAALGLIDQGELKGGATVSPSARPAWAGKNKHEDVTSSH